MPVKRFEYDQSLLSACARSELAAFVRQGSTDNDDVGVGNDGGSDKACSLLHRQHALHYGRSSPGSFSKIMINGNSNLDAPYEVDDRLRRFVQTVLLVHTHNNQNSNKNNPQYLHKLTLNRFADEDPVPFMTAHDDSNSDFLDFSSLGDWDSIDKEWVLSPFSDEEDDQNLVGGAAANLTFGRGGMGRLHRGGKKKKKHKNNKSKKLLGDSIEQKFKFPKDSEPYFSVPSLDDPDLDGELLKIRPRKSVAKHVESGEFEKTDKFGKYLDWATDQNPDGVPIVNDPFDQGECGSCWSFVATGSLEASVARRQAHEAYHEFLQEASADRRLEKHHFDALQKKAVEFAQSVEGAAFQMANLSIQELIDCDTAADQGCIGGNPLLAFYFIHRYGLSSWNDYPYVGYEDTCQKKWVSRPVAKVKSWGIISPNHEHHMELVIRFVGPIAVGVNGADRSFLAYQDGIFDHPTCRQGANHALLITGYGQEYTYDGELVKYWIARNSWGDDWGENGYIRVRRGDGLKGTRGVCGIARSPSVALGGVLLTNRHKLAPYHKPPLSEPNYMPLRSSPPKGLCSRFGFESCGRMLELFGDHKAVVLGLTGILCAAFLAVWPLTFQCRQRRYRLRRIRQIRQNLRLDADARVPTMKSPPLSSLAREQPAEIDPLLGDRNITRYGE